MSEVTVKLDNVGRNFGSVTALANVDLSFDSGRLHALVGENGAGKSTLFSLVAGLRNPSAGTVSVCGKRLRGNAAALAHKLGVGLLRQHGSLLPGLTVADNFALALQSLGPIDRDNLNAQVEQALAGIDAAPDQPCLELTVSVRQQVELARLLWAGRDLLLLDEPTAILGEAESNSLLQKLRSLAQGGKTVVFSCHRIAEVMEHADKIHVLRQGRLTLSVNRQNLDRDKLLEGMFGSANVPRTTTKPVSTPTSSDAVLEVRDLVCQGWRKPLNLTVEAGEVVGIVGLAGNNQDQLVAALAGLVPAVNGSVRVGGQLRQGRDLHSWGMGCLPSDMHDSACVSSMDVAENVVLHAYARHPNVRGGGWFTNWNAIRDRGEQVVRANGLSAAMATVPLSLLSGGNQRKVLLARELAGARHALVLHNPEAGLDARAIQDLLGDLLALKEKGTGLLVLAEDFDFLDQLATSVFLIEKGTLRQLPRAKWRNEARRALSGDAAQI